MTKFKHERKNEKDSERSGKMLLKVGAPFIATRAKNFTSIPFVKVLSIQEVISGKKYKA